MPEQGESIVEVYSDEVFTHISKETAIVQIASGFRFIEGPVWYENEKKLVFSDIPGNALYSWTEADGVSRIRDNSYLANGNTLDTHGRLVTCEHATSRVTRTDLYGGYSVLVSHVNGKQLNSPNDVIVKGDGSIYFTDPIPGRQARVGIPRPVEQDVRGIYRYDDKTSFTVLLDGSLATPNGLCFNNDESKLFVNDSSNGKIFVYDVSPNGLICNKREFAHIQAEGPGCVDGMKYSSDDMLFCTGPKGIFVIDSDGKQLGCIRIPEVAANLVLVEDEHVMYVTATSSVYKVSI